MSEAEKALEDRAEALVAYWRAVAILTGYGENDLAWMRVIRDVLQETPEETERRIYPPLVSSVRKDLESLKSKDVRHRYDRGWNACIDYLEERGYLR